MVIIPHDHDSAIVNRDPLLLRHDVQPVGRLLPATSAKSAAILNRLRSYDVRGGYWEGVGCSLVSRREGVGVYNDAAGDKIRYSEALTYAGGFTLVFRYAKRGQAGTWRTLYSLNASSYSAIAFAQFGGSPSRLQFFVGGSSTEFSLAGYPDLWNALNSSEFVTIGVTFDGATVTWCVDGDKVGQRSLSATLSGTGIPQLGYVDNLSGRAVLAEWHGVVMIPNAVSEQVLKEYTRDFYGTLFRPANESPFIIGVPSAGSAPTLSLPSVTNVLTDRATPRVTLAF